MLKKPGALEIWTQVENHYILLSLSFSLSSFLLFLLEDLPWEDWEAPPWPELPEPLPEKEEEPEEEEEAASTLLPHRAQDRSWSRTGETPSSTRKLTWSRKYNTAGRRRAWRERSETQTMLKALASKCLLPLRKDLNQLTVILHAKLLPVDRPLCSNFSTCFEMLHLQK